MFFLCGGVLYVMKCTLWQTNITIENHHVLWENPLQMAIFNSYVKLPEGNYNIYCQPRMRLNHGLHGLLIRGYSSNNHNLIQLNSLGVY